MDGGVFLRKTVSLWDDSLLFPGSVEPPELLVFFPEKYNSHILLTFQKKTIIFCAYQPITNSRY